MDEPSPPSDPDPDRPGPGADPAVLSGAVEFLTLGLTVAVTLVVAGGLGYLCDRWLGTSPWLTLVGLLLGLVAAVQLTVSRVRKLLGPSNPS